MPEGDIVYAGFWRRAAAWLLDALLLFPLLVLLLQLAYGRDYWRWLAGGAEGGLYGTLELLISYLLPLAYVLIGWCLFRGTPGKRVLGCLVVDARTGRALGPGRALLRLAGYVLSYLPLGLGFFWIGWDRRKQGFHDKLAGSLVLREPAGAPSLNEIARRLS